jgi:hypothetical protein
MRHHATKNRLPKGRAGRRASLPPGRNGHANGTEPRPAAPPSTTVATVAAPATPAAPAPEAQSPNHGACGRFVAGNKAAAGNSFHRAVAARRKALLEAVTDDDVRAIAGKLKRQALAGDTAAAKILLAYLIGKPASAASADDADLDLHELRLLRQAPLAVELLLHGLDGVPTDLAIDWLKRAAALQGAKALAPREDDDSDDDEEGGGGKVQAMLLYRLRQRVLEARGSKT